jgi:hypothetical protein
MGTLLLQLLLCLLVLTVPPFVACWSVYAVWQSEAVRQVKVVVILNLLLAISVATVIFHVHIATVNTMALVGYGLALFLFTAHSCVLLISRLFRRLRISLSRNDDLKS